MYKTLTRMVLALMLYIAGGSYLAAHPTAHALSKSQILALVAGHIVPENIAYDIASRGINFVPDEAFTSLLRAAGADSAVVDALQAAKAPSSASSAKPDEAQLVLTLSRVGALMASHQDPEAAQILSRGLANGNGRSELGFVMGYLMIEQRRIEETGAIYSEILADDPNFPEIHTRLSFVAFQSGDFAGTLREARLALKANPYNPVAHLNSALALQQINNPAAAKIEFQEAIKNKPNYGIAYYNYANLLSEMHDYAGAKEQYQRGIALNPNDPNLHYNLGVTYGEQGDFLSAIAEYREVKRLDPSRTDARQNLGAALLHTDPAGAIAEFRELVELAPDFPVCHLCLANALSSVGKNAEAERELEIAKSKDPGNANSYVAMGYLREQQQKYEAALSEFRNAESLDAKSGAAFGGAGRVLVEKKQFQAALSELSRAEELDPGNWEHHQWHGEALEALGDRKGAIAELKKATSLGTKEVKPRLSLALAQEKNGDWANALANYHQAATDEPTPKANTPAMQYHPQEKYLAAQSRFKEYVLQLRASGKAAEADALEHSVNAVAAASGLDSQYHEALRASMTATQARKFDEAETAAKQAVAIAEKIQPRDGRLPEAVGQLGNVYAWRADYKNAGAAYERQLVESEKLFGADAPTITPALQNLGLLAVSQKDFANAEKYFSRAIALNQKAYGENSLGVADLLRGLARVHQAKQDFPKAEEELLRAEKIYSTAFGPDDSRANATRMVLCRLYEQSGNSQKSAACHSSLASSSEQH